MEENVHFILLCCAILNYFDGCDGGGRGCIKGRENAFLSPEVSPGEVFFSSPCVFTAGKDAQGGSMYIFL